MSEKFASLLVACAVTAAIFTASAPATARQSPITVIATAQDVPVRYVSYRDLNLAKPEGERILVKRVRVAAKDVCVESVRFDTAFGTETVSCRSQAWHGAKPQIDRAVTRAREIAANGWSAIAPVAIAISIR
jgi:UrcA family protein